MKKDRMGRTYEEEGKQYYATKTRRIINFFEDLSEGKLVKLKWILLNDT
jgi:hypothetical protein